MKDLSVHLKDLVNRTDLNIFIYTTGAGAGIQQKIWNTPGCSSFFVGSSMPYAARLSSRALGYTPNKFVSTDMAIDLAMSAYVQAYEPGKKAIGIGLTASVASTKEHRGDHQVIVSAFSDDSCFTSIFKLKKGSGESQRLIDGELSDYFGLQVILHAAGYDYCLLKDDSASHFDTRNEARESLINKPFFSKFGVRSFMPNLENIIFYPGNYDPLHLGHAGAAHATRQMVASQYNKLTDVIFTTTADPPHKKELTSAEIMQRVAMMQGYDFMVTYGDARYIDKARRFPNASFIIGADALLRMLDPKWGIPVLPLLEEFSQLTTKFYVVGRLVNGVFTTLHDIENKFPILYKYQRNFIPVQGRWDVSSTEIRNRLEWHN